MRRTLAALATAAVMAAATAAAPAAAQAPPSPPPQAAPPGSSPHTPKDMIEEGAQLILRAFELMLRSLPEYEAPEVLDNGDIIIRRKSPLPPPQPAPEGGPAKT